MLEHLNQQFKEEEEEKKPHSLQLTMKGDEEGCCTWSRVTGAPSEPVFTFQSIECSLSCLNDLVKAVIPASQ